jgi:hypothetical protein
LLKKNGSKYNSSSGWLEKDLVQKLDINEIPLSICVFPEPFAPFMPNAVEKFLPFDISFGQLLSNLNEMITPSLKLKKFFSPNSSNTLASRVFFPFLNVPSNLTEKQIVKLCYSLVGWSNGVVGWL